MKRITLLMLALAMMAGCSQSNEESTATESGAPATTAAADAAPATGADAVPAAERGAAQAAQAAAPADPVATEANPERIQLAQADFGDVEAAGFIEGTHYRRISPTQPTSTSPDRVEVAEFFMHSCIHCYNLEPYVQSWLPNKPEFIDFARIPTTWDPVRRMHAQAWYTAVALDKDEEMNLPFFREMHERNNYLQTVDAMAEFFGQFDVSREEFESTFESFGVTRRVNRAEELGARYRVDSTPTIVINGKYRTDVGMAGGYDRLFELIELLAAAELGE